MKHTNINLCAKLDADSVFTWQEPVYNTRQCHLALQGLCTWFVYLPHLQM